MKWLSKNIGIIIFCIAILVLSVRGLSGNPDSTQLNTDKWTSEGPFELSPERGRFALTYSLVEDKSIYFSKEIARFTIPDLGYINGKYVSLFAPGVSFIVVPGYLLGKVYGVSQVGSFFVIIIFAVLNALIIQKLAKFFGAGNLTSTLSSLAFLFATPSFSYAVNLYQHHISTFLLLVSTFLLLTRRGFVKYLLIWFLFGLSLLVDYPNFFLFLPIIIYSLVEAIIPQMRSSGLTVKVDLWKYFGILGIILPLVIFFWYNKSAYGSPLQLAGTVQNVREMDSKGNPVRSITPDDNEGDSIEESGNTQNAATFFKTRNLANGLYVHLLSPDRGIIYYAPVTLFGILGIVELTKKKKQTSLLISVIGVNLILYSMWGDPWGGWGFGSRYLVPSYAFIAPFVGLAISKFRKNTMFMIMITLTFFYSLSVNTLGAITTSSNPPEVEVEYLSSQSHKVEKYTYERNIDFLSSHGSKSYFYNEFLSDWLSPWQFYLVMVAILMSLVTTFILRMNSFRYGSEIEFVLKGGKEGKNLKVYLEIMDKLKTLPRGIKFW